MQAGGENTSQTLLSAGALLDPLLENAEKGGGNPPVTGRMMQTRRSWPQWSGTKSRVALYRYLASNREGSLVPLLSKRL